MSFTTLPHDHVCEMLIESDQLALEGMRAGHGGPFGAILAVYPPNKADPIILAREYNRVRQTGFAGAHAEHNALTKAEKMLVETLLRHPGSKVILYSSGESCNTCRSKEEIFAAQLIKKGLIQKGDFIVYYAATFDDALQKAGFNDQPYLIDIKKPKPQRMIQHQTADVHQLPETLRAVFVHSPGPVAAVINLNSVMGIGYDQRGQSWLKTAEINAIEQASSQLRDFGIPESWNLNQAALMTTNAEYGPLAYATAQWANISRIIHIKTPWTAQQNVAEDVLRDNAKFFQAVASAYDHPDCVVRTYHMSHAQSQMKAQATWGQWMKTGKLAQKDQYNGCDAK